MHSHLLGVLSLLFCIEERVDEAVCLLLSFGRGVVVDATHVQSLVFLRDGVLSVLASLFQDLINRSKPFVLVIFQISFECYSRYFFNLVRVERNKSGNIPDKYLTDKE